MKTRIVLLLLFLCIPWTLYAQEVKPQIIKPQITENSIVRLSCIEVDPAQLTEYCRFAEECGRTSMVKEPGVLFMFSMADKRQPNKITILEVYTDRAAYESHIKSPHFQKYKQGTIKMVQKLELLDQTPLIPDMRMK